MSLEAVHVERFRHEEILMSREPGFAAPAAPQVMAQLHTQLTQLERERKALREGTLRFAAVVAVGSSLCALLVWLILGSGWGGVAVLVLVAGAALTVWQLLRRQEQWEQRVLDVVIPVICESLGTITYRPDIKVADFLPPFEKLGVVGDANQQRLRHHFRGHYNDTGFEFAHAVLERASRGGGKNRGGSTTVFQGLLFRIQLPFSVDQRLLISPRVKFTLFNKRGDMSAIALGDTAFDEKFMVHHDSSWTGGPEVVQQVLTPALRRALLDINAREGKLAYDMGAFVAGLMYDSLYVALTRFRKSAAIGKVQIEKPAPFLDVRFFLFQDAQLEQRIASMIDDIGIVYRMIDTLPLNREQSATAR